MIHEIGAAKRLTKKPHPAVLTSGSISVVVVVVLCAKARPATAMLIANAEARIACFIVVLLFE